MARLRGENPRRGSIYIMTLVLGLMLLIGSLHGNVLELVALAKLQKQYLAGLHCKVEFTRDEFMLGPNEILVCPIGEPQAEEAPMDEVRLEETETEKVRKELGKRPSWKTMKERLRLNNKEFNDKIEKRNRTNR
jgi:hypothetical protein